MDIKECHRVLELEIGASRVAVDNAYCDLLERWHPDRVTPAGDPAALAEAARMVQAINEAYQTLVKTAPARGSTPSPATPPAAPAPAPEAPRKPGRFESAGAAASHSPATAPETKPAAPRAKPVLTPTFEPAPTSNPPPPPPKPASTPPSAPPPPALSAPPPPAAIPKASPPPPAPAPKPPPPAISSAPVSPAPTPAPAAETAAAAAPPPEPPAKRVAVHDALFPAGSPLRRFFPLIVIGAVLVLILLGKHAMSSSSRTSQTAHGPDPTKTSTVVVKSNRADTTVEMSGAAPGTFEGSGPQFNLPGVPPGKYTLVAKSEGWPELRQEVSVEIGHPTDVSLNFKSGSLRLDSDPPGAIVKLAGGMLGKTPLVIPQLPVGDCQLSLEYPLWPAVTYKAAITENVESTATVHLPHGKLTVESAPTGANVTMAGRLAGQTPLTLDRVPAGINKVTLQTKGFPPLEVSVTVDDHGEARISKELGLGFPELDPPTVMRGVWVPDDPNKLTDGADSLGRYEPRNGIVKNLNRKLVFENWLNRRYRYSAVVKTYDAATGKIEFAEQANALSKYRILAELSPAARTNPDLPAQLMKGAKFNLYGRLTAVEEPHWPLKVITFEISLAEMLHEGGR